MKKISVLLMTICLLLAGCANSRANSNDLPVLTNDTGSDVTTNNDTVDIDQTVNTQTISPLPDTTMENLTDAVLSVSLKEGDAYVDDSGAMQMDLKIYTFDKYDMKDIADLKVGDTILRRSGEVVVTSKEQSESGTIYINGGLEEGGFDLITNDSGIFYEVGLNDEKSWYEIGEATIRVSVDFYGVDNANPELGEVELFPGSFLIGEVTNYDFTPHNTTIRVENGQIVEMNRIFVP